FFTGSALLPTYALSFASGVFFGPVWGSLVAMFGVTFGALVGYAWGTLLARKRVMRVVEANPRVKLIRSAIIDRSIKDETVAVTLIRIPPNSPFALTNLIMSSLKVRLLPYFVGTFIGIAPRTLIAVFLGVGVGELAGAKSAGGQIRIALSIAVGLAVFIFIYRLFSRWVKERLAEHTGMPAGPPAEIRPASS
ncbi:MAG: TVP38/TMEM64 family protein, partial [Phycisphaerales bacterium]